MSSMSDVHAEITDLRAEAVQAGDLGWVRVCNAALEGDDEALTECLRFLDEADAASFTA